MVMETSSVVSEFEGTLLKNKDLFSYFMLLSFEASGLTRFTALLFLWPIITLLDVFGYKNAALKLMIFVASVGLRECEIERVAKIALPKFYMDDLSMNAWSVFSSCNKKVVVTRMTRLMVEWFARDHLRADEIVGTELIVSRFGLLTGLIHDTDIDQSNLNRVANLFAHRKPSLGLGRPVLMPSSTFISLCQQIHEPVQWNYLDQQVEVQPPKPVIFHGARLVKLPTASMALLILIWIPFGIVLSAGRILVGSFLPIWAIPYVIGISGTQVIVKGKPPNGNSDGMLYVCNHRTVIDPIVISYVLGRNIRTISTNMISRFFKILTPVPVAKFTRIRDEDAATMKEVLSKEDLVLCPEGTICFQPFVLRFSSMFAEVTDKIIPVAINCKVGFFQNPIRSWDGLDMIILLMNPSVVYEVTFLNQLPIEETCTSGKCMHDVANHVQRIIAATLGFQCTDLGRKDESRFMFGNNEKSN